MGKLKKQPKKINGPGKVVINKPLTPIMIPNDARFHMEEAVAYADAFKEILNRRLMTWPDAPRAVIRTAVLSTCSFMLTSANLIDYGSRMIGGINGREWTEMMKNNHKAYFSWLHSATEIGLMRICKLNNIKVVNKQREKLESDLSNLEKKLVSLKGDELKSFQEYKKKALNWPPPPLFGDYSGKVVQLCPIKPEEKKQWNLFFRAFSIIRNKASHSDPTVSRGEREEIIAGGLEYMVPTLEGEIATNSHTLPPLLEKVLDFFELVHNHGLSKEPNEGFDFPLYEAGGKIGSEMEVAYRTIDAIIGDFEKCGGMLKEWEILSEPAKHEAKARWAEIFYQVRYYPYFNK